MLWELAIGGAVYSGVKAYQKRSRRKACGVFLQPDKAATSLNSSPLTFLGSTRRQQLQSVASSSDDEARKATEQQVNRNVTIASASLGLATVGAFGYPVLSLLSLPGFFYISGIVAVSSYHELVQHRKVGTDMLSFLVKVLLFAYGQFVLCNVSTFIYAFCRKLLTVVKDHSRKQLIDVFRQQPRSAWVLMDGVEIERPCETLQLDDIVVVHAGETIPVDGTITGGIGTVDQHMLTGEAQPVEKESGDPVFALTGVLSGRIYIRVEKTGEETTAAQIGQILNRTVDGKTDLQFWVESMSDKTVVPTLMLGACAWPLSGFMGTVAVLYSHPRHKATIAGAIDILNFLNTAAHNGILLKDGRTFEQLSQVDTVVFDKTGTLTMEQPHVGRIHPYNGYTEDEIVRFAAAAEANQHHPIARAIRRAAQERAISIPAIDDASYRVGYGVTVMLGHRLVQVGSARFMDMEEVAIADAIRAIQAECHTDGRSLVLVAVDGQLIGAIELHPTVRPEAKAMVQRLRQYGVTSMYIISGDHAIPTGKLAEELGIEHYFAETLPEHKATLIEQLQQQGKSVCYVGDGINDAIALKKARVSVSLRGASTVATDAAQVILMDQSLNHLCDLFDLAQRYHRHVRRTFMALVAPHLVGMGGALFFHFGFVEAVILAQVGLFAGLAHAMHPMTYHPQIPSTSIDHGHTQAGPGDTPAPVANGTSHQPHRDVALEREVSTRLEEEQPLMAL